MFIDLTNNLAKNLGLQIIYKNYSRNLIQDLTVTRNHVPLLPILSEYSLLVRTYGITNRISKRIKQVVRIRLMCLSLSILPEYSLIYSCYNNATNKIPKSIEQDG